MSLALIGVREYPRLGETIIVTTPNGTVHRWAEDEPDAAKAPTDSQHGSTAPGGYANWTATLPRKTGADYGDVAPLSDVEILDAAGDIIYSGRLDEAPKVSGDQMSVTPEAVGHQALLEDVKGISFLGVDPRPSEWNEAPAAEKLRLMNDLGNRRIDSGPQSAEAEKFLLSMGTTTGGETILDYVIGRYNAIAPIGKIVAKFTDRKQDLSNAWNVTLMAHPDPVFGGPEETITGQSGISADITLTVEPNNNARYAQVFLRYSGPNDGDSQTIAVTPLVIGRHGLTLHPAIGGGQGLLASDVIVHNIQRWAPSIRPRNVQQSDFVIPVSVMEDTTVAAIIQEANRYQLWNWAVWEKKAFDYAPIGTLGRRWKARTGPSQLRETGQTAKRIRNGVIVHYTDVDGTTKSVGPPGSGAHTIESDLLDPDPLNPANQAGIRMWESISMKGYGTTASATQVGREYLRQIRQLDRSGEAVIVGWIEDPSGNLHPHTSVRANDVIEFVDSSDPSPRLIVEAQHNRAARETRITLDAPRDALDAITDRLQVVVEGVVS